MLGKIFFIVFWMIIISYLTIKVFIPGVQFAFARVGHQIESVAR